jgi:ribose transport system permease protein
VQSLRSDALEPETHHFTERGWARTWKLLLHYIPVYGLVILTAILIGVFSILLPGTFCTWTNARLIMSNQSVTAVLALAAMIPMVAGKIDLSLGYGVVLSEVLAISFQTAYGLPWPLVLVLLVLIGALIGLVNALLVELAHIDSFIATLGTGTVIYAVALWYTNGEQVIGKVAPDFLQVADASLLGIPLPAIYVLILAIVLWLILDYLPIGRCLYAVGANPQAAKLNGIPTRKYIVGAFVSSGCLTAFAGFVLASRLRIGQIGVGLDYLLPALVAAFLGSTTIKPGRVNVWGTMIAVVILATGISGLQQMGGAFYVDPLFNGLTLLFAIGLAGLTGRRRLAQRKRESYLVRTPDKTSTSKNASSAAPRNDPLSPHHPTSP